MMLLWNALTCGKPWVCGQQSGVGFRCEVPRNEFVPQHRALPATFILEAISAADTNMFSPQQSRGRESNVFICVKMIRPM